MAVAFSCGCCTLEVVGGKAAGCRKAGRMRDRERRKECMGGQRLAWAPQSLLWFFYLTSYQNECIGAGAEMEGGTLYTKFGSLEAESMFKFNFKFKS